MVSTQIHTQRPEDTDDVGRHMGLQNEDCVITRRIGGIRILVIETLA